MEGSINFTYELEKNNSLPFLDILLINNNNELEFKVYHKINNKNNYIHFYSNYRDKTKSRILIVFFLKALPKFLNEEFEHIKNNFSKQQYCESFIHCAKSKAINIHKYTSLTMNKNKPSSNTNPIKKTHNITPKSHYYPYWKKLKLLRYKNHYSHNKSNKTNSKEQQLKQIPYPMQVLTKSAA